MAARGGGGGGDSKKRPRNCWLPATAIASAPQSDSDNGDQEEVTEEPPKNKFANDGSFLEMFRKMQHEQQTEPRRATALDPKLEPSRPPGTSQEPPQTVTKRKPKVLKVGIIEKKPRTETADESPGPGGGAGGESSSAWNEYMRQVRAYKQKFGDDDSDKNRPLVK